MRIEDILELEVPFKVQSVYNRHELGTVVGFSKSDPLGVGGGLLPDMPTVYFKGGGWSLLEDFLKNWELKEL